MQDLWQQWDETGKRFISPELLFYEVTNAIFLPYRLGQLSAETVHSILTAALALPIELYSDKALHRRAVEIAVQHRLKATYDAHYLALAEQHQADFWTADRKLARAVETTLPWVRCVS